MVTFTQFARKNSDACCVDFYTAHQDTIKITLLWVLFLLPTSGLL